MGELKSYSSTQNKPFYIDFLQFSILELKNSKYVFRRKSYHYQ